MMQSISLDMDDIHGAEDGYLSNEEFPPLADELPPLSPTRTNADPFGDEDNPMANMGDLRESDGDKENQGDKKRSRRIVSRKPQPKLDATRLCSDRGLPTLSKHFQQVKFKGKGHEVGDLNRLMSTMEHWSHRMFPKMPFDEVIERIEKLGRKKAVQTCVKKIRMDMPLMDEDFVEENEEDPESNAITIDADDEDEPTAFSQLAAPLSQTTGSPNTSVSLSEEQRERMERNKRMAMARRQTKTPATPSAITEDEIRDMEGAHSDEAEMEEELWKDIAMFEASQRNIWKGAAPEEAAAKKPVTAPSPEQEEPISEGSASARGKTDVIDLTESSSGEPSRRTESEEHHAENKEKETIAIDEDSSDDKTAPVGEDTAPVGEEDTAPVEGENTEVTAVTEDDIGGNGEETKDTAEGDEGNKSSEFVLKWDSESADETLQESSEMPPEAAESTHNANSLPVDENAAAPDKQSNQEGIPSNSPVDTREETLPECTEPLREDVDADVVMETINTDSVDDTEKLISIDPNGEDEEMETDVLDG